MLLPAFQRPGQVPACRAVPWVRPPGWGSRGCAELPPSATAVPGDCAGTCTLQVVSPKQGALDEPVFAEPAAGRLFLLPGLVGGPQASGVGGV